MRLIFALIILSLSATVLADSMYKMDHTKLGELLGKLPGSEKVQTRRIVSNSITKRKTVFPNELPSG
ncbi:MAG TPA: hypothetical protein VNJ08_17735 [Bacteriovoracaceae bacterium]|nr:hypothetical protein [Bacteriovoracaceae bacterium]